jgi:hypothetical protein
MIVSFIIHHLGRQSARGLGHLPEMATSRQLDCSEKTTSELRTIRARLLDFSGAKGISHQLFKSRTFDSHVPRFMQGSHESACDKAHTPNTRLPVGVRRLVSLRGFLPGLRTGISCRQKMVAICRRLRRSRKSR